MSVVLHACVCAFVRIINDAWCVVHLVRMLLGVFMPHSRVRVWSFVLLLVPCSVLHLSALVCLILSLPATTQPLGMCERQNEVDFCVDLWPLPATLLATATCLRASASCLLASLEPPNEANKQSNCECLKWRVRARLRARPGSKSQLARIAGGHADDSRVRALVDLNRHTDCTTTLPRHRLFWAPRTHGLVQAPQRHSFSLGAEDTD
jgi:hypothetical protein